MSLESPQEHVVLKSIESEPRTEGGRSFLFVRVGLTAHGARLGGGGQEGSRDATARLWPVCVRPGACAWRQMRRGRGRRK